VVAWFVCVCDGGVCVWCVCVCVCLDFRILKPVLLSTSERTSTEINEN